jgi:signal transduction histidine kinase
MRKQLLIDVGVAVAAFAGTLALMFVPESDEGHEAARDPDALGVVLAALASFPLLARRRAPLWVFVFVAAASSVLFLLGYPEGPPVGPTVALYFLALSRTEGWPRTAPIIALVAGLFALHITLFGIGRDRFPGGELLLGTILWSGVWIAGDRTRLRRERIAALEERAHRAEREAERERRLAAAEERARIARDLHDSAGHAINVILVQAGAARLLQQQDPERAREALETVEEVARETIHEIDRLVGALRVEGSVEVEPPPGLAALEGLVERHRAAGLDVRVETRGPRRSLAPGADQAAYRIIQEALTNAARHGRGGAEIDIAFGESDVEITVTNPAAADASEDGHGLVGMRERAALLGGILETDTSNGRFRLHARLPYGESARR